jgi:hypothetical protein
MSQRFIGRIVSIPGADDFAFIGIESVTKEDGSAHDLNTTQDIFLHKDDCATDGFMVGTEVVFDINLDRKRGEGAFRAVGAVKYIETELLSQNEPPIHGFAIIVPPVRGKAEIALSERLPVHANMKVVPEETVAKVVDNAPMPRIPRINDIPCDEKTKEELIRWFLSLLFPSMASFGADYNILNFSDSELDQKVEETAENYQAIGLKQEIEVMRAEVKRFKEMRGALAMIIEENLVRRDTIIPISYLPDIFMAVPVWYFWVNQGNQSLVDTTWDNSDPQPHESVEYFCRLFKSQRWHDTFQLFNRRVRTLKQYRGEIIPPQVARRMRKAIDLFDYVAIATPYHDQAGKDWEDIKWLRAIDPYVLGFKKGIPFFFVLARFSDAGTFPLFNELVADTVEFLRKNKEKLNGFNQISNPYWCNADNYCRTLGSPSGDYLKHHVDNLLTAFEAGILFDWLREEEVVAK